MWSCNRWIRSFGFANLPKLLVYFSTYSSALPVLSSSSSAGTNFANSLSKASSVVSLAERLVCTVPMHQRLFWNLPIRTPLDSAVNLEADALCAVRTFFLRASASSLAIVQVVGWVSIRTITCSVCGLPICDSCLIPGSKDHVIFHHGLLFKPSYYQHARTSQLTTVS